MREVKESFKSWEKFRNTCNSYNLQVESRRKLSKVVKVEKSREKLTRVDISWQKLTKVGKSWQNLIKVGKVDKSWKK